MAGASIQKDEWARVELDGGRTYLVRFRRQGVEPSLLSPLGFPVWLVTRARWQFLSPRKWSVEVTEQRPSGLGGKLVSRDEADTEHDARRLARQRISELSTSG